jgi:hypothetical protein
VLHLLVECIKPVSILLETIKNYSNEVEWSHSRAKLHSKIPARSLLEMQGGKQ